MEGDRGTGSPENRGGRGTEVGRGKGGMREFYEGRKRERNAKRYLLSFINALQYF